MNKTLITERFTKAIGTYTEEATAQRCIAEHMMELMKRHLHHFWPKRVVEFGCGTGNYSRLLHQHYYPQELLLNDICGEVRYACSELLQKGARFEQGDAEQLCFPKECDLITSCSTLQWFEDPNRFFERCSSYLAPGGYLAFSTFGGNNMVEIRQTTGQGLPYRTLDELVKGLQPYFDIVHAEEQTMSYHFEHPMNVLRHLKQTGVTGISAQQWTRGKLATFCEDYLDRYNTTRGVSLTYHPIYIIAKKRES